jgi:hypothetical protein
MRALLLLIVVAGCNHLALPRDAPDLARVDLAEPVCPTGGSCRPLACFCDTNADCCAGLVCLATEGPGRCTTVPPDGFCGANDECRPAGGACSTNCDCCPALLCREGVCF